MLEPADTLDIESATYPEPVYIVYEIIEKEVQKVVQRLPNDKAPGLDEIPNRCIKQCLAQLLPILQRIFQQCVSIGYHPAQFRKARTIMLQKAGKDSSTPKGWRPIALLSCISKILEAIVAQKIGQAV